MVQSADSAVEYISVTNHASADTNPDLRLQAPASLSPDELWDLHMQALAAKAQHWGFIPTLLVQETTGIPGCAGAVLASGSEEGRVSAAAALHLAQEPVTQTEELRIAQPTGRELVVDEGQVHVVRNISVAMQIIRYFGDPMVFSRFAPNWLDAQIF